MARTEQQPFDPQDKGTFPPARPGGREKSSHPSMCVCVLKVPPDPRARSIRGRRLYLEIGYKEIVLVAMWLWTNPCITEVHLKHDTLAARLYPCLFTLVNSVNARILLSSSRVTSSLYVGGVGSPRSMWVWLSIS